MILHSTKSIQRLFQPRIAGSTTGEACVTWAATQCHKDIAFHIADAGSTLRDFSVRSEVDVMDELRQHGNCSLNTVIDSPNNQQSLQAESTFCVNCIAWS
jgi:hypothetical protein